MPDAPLLHLIPFQFLTEEWDRPNRTSDTVRRLSMDDVFKDPLPRASSSSLFHVSSSPTGSPPPSLDPTAGSIPSVPVRVAQWEAQVLAALQESSGNGSSDGGASVARDGMSLTVEELHEKVRQLSRAMEESRAAKDRAETITRELMDQSGVKPPPNLLSDTPSATSGSLPSTLGLGSSKRTEAVSAAAVAAAQVALKQGEERWSQAEAELKRQLDELSARSRQLTRELETSKREREEVEASKKQLAQRLERERREGERERDRLKKEAQQAQREMEDREKKTVEAVGGTKKLEGQVRKLKMEIGLLQKELEQEREEYDIQVSQLKAEACELVEMHITEMAWRQEEHRELMERMSIVEGGKGNWEEERERVMEEREVEREQWQEQLEALEGTVEVLRAELKGKERERLMEKAEMKRRLAAGGASKRPGANGGLSDDEDDRVGQSSDDDLMKPKKSSLDADVAPKAVTKPGFEFYSNPLSSDAFEDESAGEESGGRAGMGASLAGRPSIGMKRFGGPARDKAAQANRGLEDEDNEEDDNVPGMKKKKERGGGVGGVKAEKKGRGESERDDVAVRVLQARLKELEEREGRLAMELEAVKEEAEDRREQEEEGEASPEEEDQGA